MLTGYKQNKTENKKEDIASALSNMRIDHQNDSSGHPPFLAAWGCGRYENLLDCYQQMEQ